LRIYIFKDYQPKNFMQIKKIIPLFLLAVLLNVVSCSDEENLKAPNPNSEIEALSKLRPQEEAGRIQTNGCGSYFNGSYTGSGYYTYPDRILTLCGTAGGTITIYCTALDVPNRFNVYDASNNLVASSGWMGYTSNPGPWGSSGIYGPSSKTISFTKSTSTTYKIRVETVTQGISDAWEASVGCTNVCIQPICPSSCSTFQNGNYTGSGYYTYPDRTLTFCPAQNGKTISVYCQSVEVPNRFTIYDANGNYVASSGWIGYSSNPGPWGYNGINGPGSTTITFTKSSSYSTYKLRVETVTQGISDAWESSISCQP
jgi:hypothetical protein